MGSVAGKGKEMLFFHPSGGIEPALNGFSREYVRKRDHTKEREGERKRQREAGKEARETERESAWSIMIFFFLQKKERREFLISGWGLPALRAKESGGFKTWVLGPRSTICRASGSWKLWSGGA